MKNNSLNDYYEVIYFDNQKIDWFNIVILKNDRNVKFVLLSFRLGTGVDKPPFEKYDSIQVGHKYKFNLIPQDSTYVVDQQFIFNHRGGYQIILEDMLFLQNDTIKTKVYRSKDVFDKFVRIE